MGKHLYSVIPISAKQVNELEPGDVIVWPVGDSKTKQTVLRLLPTPTGNLYTVVLENPETGKWIFPRLAAERLVGLS